MPLQLARMSGTTNYAEQASATLYGGAKFASEMKPAGILGGGGAKALMLKDSDYSTPSDHYFSYTKKIKEDKTTNEEKEATVMAEMNVNQSHMKELQKEASSKK